MIKKKGMAHLQDRINAAKIECAEMENQLSTRVDYIQENFVSMATSSLVQNILSVPKSLVQQKDILGNMLKAKSIKDFIKKTFIDIVKTIAMRFGLNLVREFAEKQAENRPESEATNSETETVVNSTEG